MASDVATDSVTVAVEAFERQIRESEVDFSAVDPQELGSEAADWATLRAMPTTSLIGRRIGPVHTIEALAEHLRRPQERPLSSEAVRKRAINGDLVAFTTSDGKWAFPDWQFDRVASMLLPREEVVALWNLLPTAGFLTSADLAAWMNTRFADLESLTPADYANTYGASHPILAPIVLRLESRSSDGSATSAEKVA